MIVTVQGLIIAVPVAIDQFSSQASLISLYHDQNSHVTPTVVEVKTKRTHSPTSKNKIEEAEQPNTYYNIKLPS